MKIGGSGVRAIGAIVVGFLVVVAGASSRGGPAWAQSPGTPMNVKIMSSNPGGDFFTIGSALGKIFAEEIPGFNLTVVPGGAVGNVLGIENGQTEMGFSFNSLAYSAVKGEVPFKQPMQKVRFFASLTNSAYQLVVRKDANITSVGGLRGQAMATLPPGNIGELATRQVLGAASLTYKDLAKVNHGGFSDGTNQVRDKQVSALSIVFIIPSGLVAELAATTPIDLVSLDERLVAAMAKLNPGYQPYTLPAGMYRGVDHPVRTFISRVNLLISAGMPADVVYQMTKALTKNIQALGGINVAFARFAASDLADNPTGLPFHEGALRYYREAGAVR